MYTAGPVKALASSASVAAWWISICSLAIFTRSFSFSFFVLFLINKNPKIFTSPPALGSK